MFATLRSWDIFPPTQHTNRYQQKAKEETLTNGTEQVTFIAYWPVFAACGGRAQAKTTPPLLFNRYCRPLSR